MFPLSVSEGSAGAEVLTSVLGLSGGIGSVLMSTSAQISGLQDRQEMLEKSVSDGRQEVMDAACGGETGDDVSVKGEGLGSRVLAIVEDVVVAPSGIEKTGV